MASARLPSGFVLDSAPPGYHPGRIVRHLDGDLWFGVALATAGLALISINGVSIELAQIWGVICAALFAAHIVGLGAWSPGRDAYALTITQLGTSAVVCWFGALIDGYQAPPSGDVWFAVLFTAVLATSVAFFVQTWAQGIMDASRVAIILTSEVVFAAAIAVMVGQEVLTLKTLLGGALMVVAMLVVEWPSRRKNHEAITPRLID